MLTAELLKLRTVAATKVTVALGVVGLLVTQVLLVTLLPALASGAIDTKGAAAELGTIDPGSVAFQYSALNPLGGMGGVGSVSIATIAVVVLGLLVATTDYRFGGIVTTALAQPRRLRILGGKVAATAVVAAGLAVVYAVVVLGNLLVATLVIPGAELVLPAVDIVSTLVRGAAVVVLLALLGVGIGVIVRSQLAGILVVISLLVLEPIVQALAQALTGGVPLWAQLLPLSLGQAAIAQVGSLALHPLVALAALAGIVLAVLVAAGAALRRRDL